VILEDIGSKENGLWPAVFWLGYVPISRTATSSLPQYSEAEINHFYNFAASRLRVKPDPVESHAKPRRREEQSAVHKGTLSTHNHGFN